LAQAADWQGVTINTLCLVQNYDQFGSYYDLTNFQNEMVIIFSRMGLKVVAASQPCDATLTISLTGAAQDAYYEGNLHCYTGSRTSGTFTLSAPNRAAISTAVSSSLPTSEVASTNNCPDSDHAPYLASLTPATLDGLVSLYGPVIYGWILVEEGEETWCNTPTMPCGYFHNDLLQRFVPGAEAAVPALIVALDSEQELTRRTAVGGLQTITGQSYGNDKQAWEQWWAANGSALPPWTGDIIGKPTPTIDFAGRVATSEAEQAEMTRQAPTPEPGTTLQVAATMTMPPTITLPPTSTAPGQ
jgi:hypothetical protein